MPVFTQNHGHGLVLISKEFQGAYSLMHYRTKGSKNGQRLYQDKDGKLTPLGYQHYAEMYGWGKGRQKDSIDPEVEDRYSKPYYNDNSVKDLTGLKKTATKVVRLRNSFHNEMNPLQKLKAETDIQKLWNELNKVDYGNAIEFDDMESMLDSISAIKERKNKADDLHHKFDSAFKQGYDAIHECVALREQGKINESDELYKLYKKYNTEENELRSKLENAVKELGRTSGYGETTWSDLQFEKSVTLCSQDRNVLSELKSRINSADDSLTEKAEALGSELQDSIESTVDAWNKYSEKWDKDTHGREWDGDGSEFHEELMSRYPEYKKVNDDHNKIINSYVKECIKISKSSKFGSVMSLKQYKNFFDYYRDGGCSVGLAKAYAIANVILPKWNEKEFVNPMWFVEYFDKDGKQLKNQWLD